MADSNDFDLITLALAHKFITRDEADRVQLLVERDRVDGKERPLEEILIGEGVLTEEELWALRKARDRMERDSRVSGEKIGPYQIISTVGEGGLGVVYRARQISMGRDVALKVLHEKWIEDEEFRKRFLLEARLVGRLNHPNLIQVFDVGRDGNKFYYSMEFVDGEPAEDVSDRDGPKGLRAVIDIDKQDATAIQYLKQHKIVHRDIKPGNIMMTTSGVAKLGDFGFVKSNLDELLSSEGEVLGTPDYMSPEVACGEENVDFRSDIYSLGATMYHMIAGRPPFGGSSSSVMEAHIKESAPPLRDYRPEVSDLCCLIIEKMMAKRPEDRYDTLSDLFDDLEYLRMDVKGQAAGDPGKSTIMQALERSKLRAEDMLRRQNELQKRADRLSGRVSMLYGALGLAGLIILLLIAFLVS